VPLGPQLNLSVRHTFEGESMIIKSIDANKRRFLGVDFVVLSHGEKSMITKMQYKKEDSVPMHKHPNEQSGYVISGRYRIRFGDIDQEIEPGDSYTIPKNIMHSIDIIEAGEVLDCFSPPRQDYL
jgi:quercetin dioxygenase-like cupin family protein